LQFPRQKKEGGRKQADFRRRAPFLEKLARLAVEDEATFLKH
jgi:hypothetical protein